MWIGALWLAQCAAMAAGSALRRGAGAEDDGLPKWLRLSVAASLVLAACGIARDADATAPYARAASIGMGLSFVGDLLMARVIPFPNRLVGGMLAFGAGHVLYMRAYTAQIAASGAPFPAATAAAAIAAYAAFTLFAWRRWIRNPAGPAAVNLGALLYGTLIAAMAGVAFGLAATLGGAWRLSAAGAAFFVGSDLLIGVTAIGGRVVNNAQRWIWLTYVAGQMGIVYAPWVAGM